MEIEKKFRIKKIPENLESFEHFPIEQGYLCTDPVVRVRRQGSDYILTYKGKGMLAREEYNLPLTEEAYAHLIQKADGKIITKTRYKIPFESHTIELDIFEGAHAPLILAEVEFDSIEEAQVFSPPDWFDIEVTMDPAYHNSNMI